MEKDALQEKSLTTKLQAKIADRPSDLPALTGIRFLAALSVIFYHFYSGFDLPYFFHIWADVGFTGVTFFFVLSGFILTYNYFDRFETLGIKEFWKLRFARIYPIYAVSLLISIPGDHMPGIAILVQLITRLTLVHAWFPRLALGLNAPSWTISVEAFFYLVFPFLLGRLVNLKDKSLWGIMIGMCLIGIIAPVTLFLTHPAINPNTNDFWVNVIKCDPLLHLPSFVAGIAAGIYFLRNPGIIRRIHGDAAILTGLFIIGGLSIARVPYILLYTCGCIIPSLLIVFGAATGKGFISKLFSWRPMLKLGEASYSMYILQRPVFGIVFFIWLHFGNTVNTKSGKSFSFFDTLVCTAILIFVSLASHKYFEEPIRKLIRRSRRKSTPNAR